MIFNFSYKQEIYDELKEGARRYLKWTNKEKTWNYKDCTVTVLGINNCAHIVLRRERTGKSSFKNSNYKLKLMIGFTATNVQKIHLDSIHELKFTIQQSNDKNHRDLSDVKIWSDDKDEIDNLYQTIHEKIQNPEANIPIIEPNYLQENSKTIPVIYQPRIDAWKNFLGEINVHKENDVYQVTLAFEGEVLRKFFLIDPFYKFYRFLRFRRTVDIETFEIKKDQFYFKDIYSDDDTLFDDSTHNEKTILIKYYFSDENHPVLFVNTSNHALAPHDNNHDFWKWEYVPWDKNTPLKLGDKTRQELKNPTRDFRLIQHAEAAMISQF